MSKEKPEVGDVWEVDFAKYIVMQVENDIVRCFVNDFRLAEFSTSFLQKFCVYLGKSKVEINDLFDVRRIYDA